MRTQDAQIYVVTSVERNAFNPNTCSTRPVWSTQQVLGQPDLCREEAVGLDVCWFPHSNQTRGTRQLHTKDSEP